MAILYGVYAGVLLAGGVMGYTKAQSVPSLVAGVVSAALMAVAIVLLSTHLRVALIVGAVVSVALYFVFSARYRKTRKAMPSVVIMALSTIVFLASMFALFPPPHA